jgi:hypothetical protein
MTEFSDTADEQNAFFRVFVARIIAFWQFMVFLCYWLAHLLPYQLFPDLPFTLFNYSLNQGNTIWAVLASTSCLLFFIIPGRTTALLSGLSQLLCMAAYLPSAPDLFIPIYPWLMVAFLPKKVFFDSFLRFISISLLAYLALLPWIQDITIRAIPSYTFFLVALIPWKAWFNRYMSRFEPR